MRIEVIRKGGPTKVTIVFLDIPDANLESGKVIVALQVVGQSDISDSYVITKAHRTQRNTKKGRRSRRGNPDVTMSRKDTTC